MKIEFDYENSVISEDVLEIKTSDLDDFYAKAHVTERMNLFFVLLNLFNLHYEKGDNKRAGYLSFLMAYYVFVPLTPPASAELALNFINKAIELDENDEYIKWKEIIKKGN